MEVPAAAIGDGQDEQRLRELVETQTTLRRLATLIARGEPHESVLRAVTTEAVRQFGKGTACVLRYEPDGTATLVAGAGPGPRSRVGERSDGRPPIGLTATVLRTGRPARIDDYRSGEPFLPAETRSAAAMPIHVNGRLWGTVAVGSGPRLLPPDTEPRLAELAELLATAVANAQARAEIMASRARLVAASDEARRRIERDLHDGAQQLLITLILRLRAVVETPTVRDDIRTEIEDIAGEFTGVLDDLRELSRGIHPAILSKGGLRPALRALARRSAVPVVTDVRVHGRLPEPVEVGAYCVVSEVLASATKHARASTIEVDAVTTADTLQVRVRDDGIGGADLARGSGLIGLRDRIEALGGRFSVYSPPGGGTTVSCELPVTTPEP